MTCSSILGITLDVFSSPKSVRNYSSHQNRWGETCYIVVTNKMFFSVIKSVLKSSLNSVQSYRNKKIRVKNVTEFSEKNVIHREGRRSVHWIRWQKRKFTEFSDEFFTGGYSAHICRLFNTSVELYLLKIQKLDFVPRAIDLVKAVGNIWHFQAKRGQNDYLCFWSINSIKSYSNENQKKIKKLIDVICYIMLLSSTFLKVPVSWHKFYISIFQ